MSDKINPIYRKKIEDIKVEGEYFANNTMKGVYADQKDALDEIHKYIGQMYIDFGQDGLIKISSSQKNNLTVKLKAKLQALGTKLSKSEVAKVRSILGSVFKLTYYKNAFTIESGMTTNINFKILRQDFVDKAVNQAYKGEMFSDRIWKNKADMIDKLQSSIVEAMKGNVHLDKVAGDIKNTFNVTAYQSHRLLYTEGARVQSQAQLQIGKDSGCKKVMWSATLDTKTNPEDASLDGQVWDIDNPNKPQNPHHPNCRCCWINIPPTNWSPTERRDNETKQVIAYQNYSDWAKAKGIDPSDSVVTSHTNNSSDIIKDNPIDNYFSGLSLSAKATQVLTDIHADLLSYSQKHHQEKLMTMDTTDGSKGIEVEGTKSSVTFTPQLMNQLANVDDDSMILAHNHPGSSSFSDADLWVMCRYNSLKAITVQAENGTRYMCRVGDGKRPDYPKDITNKYLEFRNNLLPRYQDLVRSGKLDPKEAWYKQSHETMEELAKYFGWDYERIEPND